MLSAAPHPSRQRRRPGMGRTANAGKTTAASQGYDAFVSRRPSRRRPGEVARPTTHHLPLANLEVTKSWRVAGVTLRPSGWLAKEIERRHAIAIAAHPRLVGKPVVEFFMEPSRDMARAAAHWATAQVVSRSLHQARESVRDVVALLRLFQRGRTRTNLDKQTFGLPVDIYAVRNDYIVAPKRSLPRPGFQWHGIVASWKFDDRQIRQFRGDARFRWLEEALAREPSGRTELQERLITALRFVNLATVLLPPAVLVALRALALEALFRDEERANRRHRIARRIAYLTCGRPNRWSLEDEGQPHRWPDRPACFYLEATTYRQVKHEMIRLKAKEVPNVCSAYWDSWDLFEDRDEVMHEARTSFSDHALGWHEINLDVAILTLVAWAAKSGAVRLSQLDAEIADFVSKGVRRWDTGALPSESLG